MVKRGKIIFLHSGTDLYGAAKILLYVIGIFKDQGYNILIILPGDGPLKIALEKLGFQVEITNLGILRRKHFTPYGVFNRFKRLYKSYRFLKKIHQREKIDLIYSNTLAVIVGAVFSRRKKIPHCWHIHEIIASPRFLVRFLARWIDSSTQNPIMVSDAVATHWNKFLKKATPVVIHNGIVYSPYYEPKIEARRDLQLPIGKIIITMVGRINPGKGQSFFLEIAKELIQKHKNIHFLMVGDPYPGYEQILESINSYICQNNLKSHVEYLGFREDIPEILKASDIFVLPSILPDSFPTVVLEAMATGLPVVATRSGGVEEMIKDGETGFLIDIGDSKMGVERLSTLITQPENAQNMGKRGQIEVMHNYSYERFTQNIQNYICQILPATKS